MTDQQLKALRRSIDFSEIEECKSKYSKIELQERLVRIKKVREYRFLRFVNSNPTEYFYLFGVIGSWLHRQYKITLHAL